MKKKKLRCPETQSVLKSYTFFPKEPVMIQPDQATIEIHNGTRFNISYDNQRD